MYMSRKSEYDISEKMDFYSGESNYTPSTFVFIPTWDEELKITIICC